MFPKLFADRININYLRPKVPKGCPTKIRIICDMFFCFTGCVLWINKMAYISRPEMNIYGLWEDTFEAKPGGVR